MKKKKKKYNKVVINNTELVPTTIGEIDEKEGGAFFVIVIFAALIVVVVFLPNITTYFNGILNPSSVQTEPVPTPSEPTEPEEDPGVEKELEYLSLASDVDKVVKGYRFVIKLNTELKSLNVTITNESGSNTLFVNTPYYFELYSQDKKLLQRIKLTSEEISVNKEETYDINDAYNNGEVAYVVINEMDPSDYPAITLGNLDDYNNPYLTCSKDNETLTYTFDQNKNTYSLISIKDSLKVTDNSEDTINSYEVLENSYSSIDGVEASLLPNTNGFTFETTIDLSKVKISEKKRILTNSAYYEKDTEAKTVSFELTSSGYICN